MLRVNEPILQAMYCDPAYHAFIAEIDELFRGDPGYRARKLRTILEGAARGERIIRFEDRYVVSSFVPPVPSPAFLNFLTGGVDRDRLFSDLAYARRSAPLSAHVCITCRCSYRCEHCGWTVLDRQSELTTAEWIRVIGDMQDLGVAMIVFSGGEPLMRDDMEEIIASMDDRSSTLLFTNGRYLTPERARALKQSGLFTLAVSLDSPDAAEHNRIRRNPRAFEHALDAIRNASEAGLYTVVSSVVYARDLHEENLHRIFRLARDHGAHEVRIHRPIPRGELSDQPKEGVFHTQEDTERLIRIQFAANEALDEFPKVSSFPYTEGPCKFGCGAGVTHSYITSTGDLWPCDFVPLRFGNVLHEDLGELYGRMIAAAGIPRNRCLASCIAGRLRGKDIPLDLDESVELCQACRSDTYPQFFSDLQADMPSLAAQKEHAVHG